MTTCKETLLIMNIQTFTHHLKDKLSFIHSFFFFFKVKLTFFFTDRRYVTYRSVLAALQNCGYTLYNCMVDIF